MPEPPLPLLNVFEVEVEGTTRHLVCFLDAVLAGARGIDGRAVIGEFTPDAQGEFDVHTFQPNPQFAEALTEYMNVEAGRSPEVAAQARGQSSGWLYLLDPRTPPDPTREPPASDLVGCFAIDERGELVPDSFRYNPQHVWFDPVSGVSGLLCDRRFYDWLHRVEGE